MTTRLILRAGVVLAALLVTLPATAGVVVASGSTVPSALQPDAADCQEPVAAPAGEPQAAGLTAEDREAIYALMTRYERALAERRVFEIKRLVYAATDEFLEAHEEFFRTTEKRSLSLTGIDIREAGPAVIFTRNEAFVIKKTNRIQSKSVRITYRLIHIDGAWKLVAPVRQ